MIARGFLAFALVMLVSIGGMAGPALAKSAQEINAEVDVTLKRFKKDFPAGAILAKNAHGILVFPSVTRGGVGIGGSYGEGALRVRGKTVAYYSTASASIGVQLGVQSRSEVILFMTADALEKFRNSDGWEAGVDGSVAAGQSGAAGKTGTTTGKDPIIGYVFGEEGLMFSASFEGAKYSKLDK